ncbi:hypothetical protein [Effusibacillus consociatus]|uniref:Transposase n=1 Tax=Effusibacillus consociatus TaxID=1117041 RepID=A0ABV9Q205_9BACL
MSGTKHWIRLIGYVRVGEHRGVLYQHVHNKSLWKWRNCIVKADDYRSAIQKLNEQNVIPK